MKLFEPIKFILFTSKFSETSFSYLYLSQWHCHRWVRILFSGTPSHHSAAPSQVCLGPLEASPLTLGPSCNKNPGTDEDCCYTAESNVTNAQGGCGVLGIITRWVCLWSLKGFCLNSLVWSYCKCKPLPQNGGIREHQLSRQMRNKILHYFSIINNLLWDFRLSVTGYHESTALRKTRSFSRKML